MILQLNGDFDDVMCRKIVLGLTEARETGVMRVRINIASNGGYVYVLETIVDEIVKCRKKGMEVDTHNVSHAYSCGAMLLSFGDKRTSEPQAQTMIHEVGVGSLGGKIQELEKAVSEIRELNDKWFSWLAKNMKTSRKKLEKLVDGKDMFLSAKEALELKVIDEILYLD